MLFKSPGLNDDELRVIDAIASIYKNVKFALSSPMRWSGVLHRNLWAQAIRGSNSIEGYLVSKEDAVAAVEGEEPFSAQDETWLEIMGYRDAMTYVLQLSKDPRFVFNEGFLRSLHFMMLKHDLSKNPGNWRPGPIFVRDDAKQIDVYEAPPAERIHKLIDVLIQYLRSSEDASHLTVKGAMAHLNLVMIHPFSDGNGRMSRCLQTLVLAQHGVVNPQFCSIEEYLGRNRREYYDVLAKVGQGSWHPKNDTRPWIEFNLTAHYRQAAMTLIRMRVYSRLWDELENQIQKKNLPERCISILSDASMGFHIRSIHYQKAAEVSNVVASRDLNLLVKAGLFEPSGEKRGRIYAASKSLRDIYLGIRQAEFREIKDPFKAKELLTV